ncbi:MAG: TrbC/VirB2 family protein [Sphingomonadales bacterium]|nr:TrbC/VirB2 family protein [Sphingomonadales bacterium]
MLQESPARDARGGTWLALAAAFAVLVLPVAAMADPTNITNGLNSIETWLISAAKIIAVIAFIGCGLAKMMGRMQWGYFFSVMAGCAIVFGAAQLAQWMQ